MLFPLVALSHLASRPAHNSTYPGTVLVATLDGRIYALDAWTGKQQWSFESGGPLISSSSSAVLTNTMEEEDDDYNDGDQGEDGTPVNCAVSSWLPWSRCTKSCDRGTQLRLRKIQQRARYGGKGCPPLSVVRACNTRDCADGPFEDDEADTDSLSVSRLNEVLHTLFD